MSRKKLSIVNQKEAAAEVAQDPEKIELKVSEKIAFATLLQKKESLEKQIHELNQQMKALTAEIFERAGVSKESQTPYSITPDALIKQL
jgi:cell division protein FtsB